MRLNQKTENIPEVIIQFNDVSFTYGAESEPILENVNLEIKKGQSIGICGPSGSGKTSMLKLLMRLYDVTSGSITIDGTDIREYYLGSLRDRIGVVSQDTYIFNGTIYDNIMYGVTGNVTVVDIIHACINANILDFIISLPDKIKTKVGENGLMLSGGQKQRIALARIFLKNPDIILLDESTAFLDNESERAVLDSLTSFRNKTIITVAHRLSTIKNCDEIIVIDKHGIAEHGTHDELINAGGLYAKLNADQSESGNKKLKTYYSTDAEDLADTLCLSETDSKKVGQGLLKALRHYGIIE